ncbi:FMN-linked oxidoreductase [Artomyces pyxidatus]|uniref:FMN-linked oxidoreductase n=1 Tax=Artomyces pyxidatus TaxID=48021 RepID=A0ACB8SKZ6_9AGAM|nr:FMN-linked oxidoreductase [Artomyces pyxidatus]
MSFDALFHPIKLGDLKLQHRVVLAPLTRFRANDAHEHTDLGIEYYAQRASVPGTLLITEATFIAQRATGYPNAPGVWSDKQIAAWKKITDAVHAKGSFIVLQLWALGRAAYPAVLQAEGGFPLVSASDIPMEAGAPAPRALTIPEIKEYVGLYATAAENAVHKAGFDAVEIHCANGYLPDQFLQDTANKRNDEYGGSIENRMRFAEEIIAAVVDKVGAKRTGIRFSPWSRYQGMRMEDPIPTFSALVTKIRDTYPEFAYIHVVEGRITGNEDDEKYNHHTDSNQFLREIWGKRPYIAAGGFHADTAAATVEKDGGLIAFGRYFLANPDLPTRLKTEKPLTKYNRATFYTPGPIGYIDYKTFEAETTKA